MIPFTLTYAFRARLSSKKFVKIHHFKSQLAYQHLPFQNRIQFLAKPEWEVYHSCSDRDLSHIEESVCAGADVLRQEYPKLARLHLLCPNVHHHLRSQVLRFLNDLLVSAHHDSVL